MAAADAPNYAQRLGIHKDQIVQELGWDEDTDDDIRADIEDACGGELLDEDSDEVVDVVLLWWRDSDGKITVPIATPIRPSGSSVMRSALYSQDTEPSCINDAQMVFSSRLI